MKSDGVDVLVLGGGPGGMALALTLARHGRLSVAVTERSDYSAPRIGETLSPGVVPLLHHLGLWSGFCASGHQTSYGTAAAWGSDEVQSRDYLYTPHGPGWHLDRARFDAHLATSAEEAGARVWRGTHPSAVRREGETWVASLVGPDGPGTVRARFVVDATGRRASFARAQGALPRAYDRQVAVAAVVPTDGGDDSFTLVESRPDGWWYSARLPHHVGPPARIVAFLTDTDRVRAGGLGTLAGWTAALDQARHTRAHLLTPEAARGLRVHPARSSLLGRAPGAAAATGWLAVGDAALSVDPLSASGIARALDGGIRAAGGVEAWLRRGDGTLLDAYELHLQRTFAAYLQTRAAYCALERRWAGEPFWRRRTAPPLLPTRPDASTSARSNRGEDGAARTGSVEVAAS